MPNTLSATAETYAKILAWGGNESNSDEWYHPISRHQFAQGLSSLKVGDTVAFDLDGVSTPVRVLDIGTIYDYPKMRHVNGDFHIPTMLVDRVIQVRK